MKVRYKNEETEIIIYISGELDHHSAKNVIEECGQILCLNFGKRLILDLKELSFMDSSGIAVLLNIKRSLLDSDDGLVVINTPQSAMRVFKAAGIDKIVKFEKAVTKNV